MNCSREALTGNSEGIANHPSILSANGFPPPICRTRTGEVSALVVAR